MIKKLFRIYTVAISDSYNLEILILENNQMVFTVALYEIWIILIMNFKLLINKILFKIMLNIKLYEINPTLLNVLIIFSLRKTIYSRLLILIKLIKLNNNNNN